MQKRLFSIGFIILISAAVVSASAPSYVLAATNTLSAIKDNTLINSATGDRSNATGSLLAGRTGGQGAGALRALMAFDIDGAVPAGSTITDVKLTLNVLQGGGGSGLDSYALHRVTQDWGEGTSNGPGGAGAPSTAGDATWIHTFYDSGTWNNAGGDFVSAASAAKTIGTVGAETWLSTPALVADVQGWLDDPSSNFGWILIGDEGVASSARHIASREQANGPSLSITYVPEPSTMVIGLVGLFGTLGCSRKVRL